MCTYEGGYIDAKVIDAAYLEKAAERGSEPTCCSFLGAKVLWSRIPELQALVDRIPVFDEKQRLRKLEEFYAQVVTWGHFFFAESVEKDNRYLRECSVTETVFFAARYVLEYNRVLFPGHKSLFAYLPKAAQQPADFERLANALMVEKTPERMKAFCQAFEAFAPVKLDFLACIARFMEDSEKNWTDGPAPVQDRYFFDPGNLPGLFYGQKGSKQNIADVGRICYNQM